MTYNDRARPQHTQYVPCIQPPYTDERVVGIYASQNRFVACCSCHIQYSLTEHSRSGSKEMEFAFLAGFVVGMVDISIDFFDLFGQNIAGQGNAWLIVHSMVA